MSHSCRAVLRGLFLSSLPALLPALALGRGTSFALHFDADAFPQGFEGDVLVAFAELEGPEPRRAMHGWFGAPPLLRFHVEARAGAQVALDPEQAVATFPRAWDAVEAGEWRVQAVARVNPVGREPGLDEGDAFSVPLAIVYDPASDEVVELALDQVVPASTFRETERVRLFELESELLTRFHDFPYVLRAGVLLPADYDPQATYPVVYSVTGFGGTHESVHRWANMIPAESPLAQVIVVVPDATNRYGHSVFCDSANNGPWGRALTSELIPALEAEFGGAGAEHRYVTGVSSGGWSSLWLQVTYPEVFAGCWSHVPDPIDFHDFQQIDLYTALEGGAARNMYVDEEGREREVGRLAQVEDRTYRSFVAHEHALGPGGQIRSFEATFSPPGPDGTPRRVFDVASGVIDHALADGWRRYDISHLLLTGWDDLRPRLAGKIHVYAGELDTFYLEGAVRRFRELALEAGLLEDMVVEVVPGMPHTLHAAGHQAMIDTIAARWAARGTD